MVPMSSPEMMVSGNKHFNTGSTEKSRMYGMPNQHQFQSLSNHGLIIQQQQE